MTWWPADHPAAAWTRQLRSQAVRHQQQRPYRVPTGPGSGRRPHQRGGPGGSAPDQAHYSSQRLQVQFPGRHQPVGRAGQGRPPRCGGNSQHPSTGFTRGWARVTSRRVTSAGHGPRRATFLGCVLPAGSWRSDLRRGAVSSRQRRQHRAGNVGCWLQGNFSHDAPRRVDRLHIFGSVRTTNGGHRAVGAMGATSHT
jgi:hypothetical protein